MEGFDGLVSAQSVGNREQAHAARKPGTLKIQFIGNMAFHITDGHTSLLTDFPYRPGAYGFMKYNVAEIAPIVDGLSLITHAHRDHWSPRRFKALGHTVMAPPRILRKLRGRKTVPFGRFMTHKDIGVEAIKTPHRFSPEHHSYVITWHGLRLFFPGDAESPMPFLEARNMDLMFVTPPIVRILHRHDRRLDAQRLVLAHQRERESVPPYQDCLRMQQGESLELPFKIDSPVDRETPSNP